MSRKKKKHEILTPPRRALRDLKLRSERSFFLTGEELDLARWTLRDVSKMMTRDEDAQQAAYLGVIEAAHDYGPENEGFRKYAKWIIKRSIYQDQSDRNDLKEKDYTKWRQWVRTEDRLAQELQRWPTWQEVASDIGMSLEEADRVRRLSLVENPRSLNEPIRQGLADDSSYFDDIEIQEAIINYDSVFDEDDLIDEMDREQLIAEIQSKIDLLVETQREVVIAHFLGGVSISEIAADKQVTVQAIHLRKYGALGNLAKELAESA